MKPVIPWYFPQTAVQAAHPELSWPWDTGSLQHTLPNLSTDPDLKVQPAARSKRTSSSEAVGKVHQKNLPRDRGLLFVFLSISELNHQNTFLRCSRKSWNFLSSLCSPARKHLDIFLVIQPLQPSWAQPGALRPGVGCDVHRAQGGTETLWWRALLSPNQNITHHHWGISDTAWARSPSTRQPGLSAPAHQEPHSTVTGSMRITTADGQPSESVNNKMSLKKNKRKKKNSRASKSGRKTKFSIFSVTPRSTCSVCSGWLLHGSSLWKKSVAF